MQVIKEFIKTRAAGNGSSLSGSREQESAETERESPWPRADSLANS